MTAYDLERTYLFIDGAGGVVPAPVTPDFWQRIGAIPEAGDTLITVSESAAAWERWEMHPAGDEILVILEGSPRLWLEHPDGRLQAVATQPGATVVVPKGAWHRADEAAPYRILFVTYGKGTTHRPVTDEDHAKAAAVLENAG